MRRNTGTSTAQHLFSLMFPLLSAVGAVSGNHICSDDKPGLSVLHPSHTCAAARCLSSCMMAFSPERSTEREEGGEEAVTSHPCRRRFVCCLSYNTEESTIVKARRCLSHVVGWATICIRDQVAKEINK